MLQLLSIEVRFLEMLPNRLIKKVRGCRCIIIFPAQDESSEEDVSEGAAQTTKLFRNIVNLYAMSVTMCLHTTQPMVVVY
jgi:hypothetical protein